MRYRKNNPIHRGALHPRTDLRNRLPRKVQDVVSVTKCFKGAYLILFANFQLFFVLMLKIVAPHQRKP